MLVCFLKKFVPEVGRERGGEGGGGAIGLLFCRE